MVYLNIIIDILGDLDQSISDSPSEHCPESMRIRDSGPDDLIDQLMVRVKDGKLLQDLGAFDECIHLYIVECFVANLVITGHASIRSN